MLKVFLLTLFILALGFLGMGLKIIFHKTHSFPQTSAGHNPEMRKRGISCPKKEEPFCNTINKDNGCDSCSAAYKKKELEDINAALHQSGE